MAKMKKITLTSRRILLRSFNRKHDAPLFKKWLSDPEVTKYFSMTKEDIEESIKRLSLKRIIQSKDSIFFVIEAIKPEGNITIGTCKLNVIKLRSGTAEFTIMIGNKDYWSKGYGAETAQLLIGYGFNQLNLHRIGAGVLEFNERSRKMLEKIGFRVEGFTEEDTFFKGQRWNTINLRLFKREWNKSQ